MGNPFEGWEIVPQIAGAYSRVYAHVGPDDTPLARFHSQSDALKFLAMAKAFGEMKHALDIAQKHAPCPLYADALASAEAVEKVT